MNIEQVSHTKLLGVIIDENVTWREQIKTVETKVSKIIAVLYKTKDVLDIKNYARYTNHLLNHMCLIAVKYGEIRIRLDSENSLFYRKKLYE